MHTRLSSFPNRSLARRAMRQPRNTVVLLTALLLCGWRPSAPPDDRIEQMEAHTVRIFCQTEEGIGTGTGFVIGQSEHVVTNHHVISCVEAGGQAFVGLGLEDILEVQVVWSSEEKDLAVLGLGRRIDRPPVTFMAERFVERGDNVDAMGFPGAADRNLASSAFEPTLTRGIISRLVEDDNGWKLYQTDAAINPGNSGGPLFNPCAQLVGINVLKALTAVYNASGERVRVPEGEGIGWAIRADVLMDVLDEIGIPYEQAHAVCSPASATAVTGRDPLVIGGLVLALLLALAAVGLGVTARGRAVVQQTFHTLSRGGRSPAPAPPVALKKPLLRGISGPYAGSLLELGDEPLSIGRDPRISQLVFPPDTSGVSKRHCTLAYDAASRRFILEDCWSTNGTFLASGVTLTPGEPHSLKPGDRFYLSERENMFEVQLEG